MEIVGFLFLLLILHALCSDPGSDIDWNDMDKYTDRLEENDETST